MESQPEEKPDDDLAYEMLSDPGKSAVQTFDRRTQATRNASSTASRLLHPLRT
jgi:hypothetical protein